MKPFTILIIMLLMDKERSHMVVKGLEGVTALSSEICSIIDGVLAYRGYHIDDLAEQSTFEEVAFLLWNGHLPNREELAEHRKALQQNAAISDKLIDQIRLYPTDAHPMTTLRTAVSALSMFDVEADVNTLEANQRKAIRLTAKIPTIIAAIARIRDGKQPLAPRSDLGLVANFLYMLTGNEPSEVAVQALDKVLILQADHELNASTFTARVTAATLADMYSSVTAAIGALKGPLHGGANEQVMVMLREIGSKENTEPYILNKLNNKQKIMGFGHRVYKNGDPRAKHLRAMSRKLGEQHGDTKWYEISEKVEALVAEKKGLKPNVDFYSATVYHYLDLSEDLFTPLFAMSRITGWTAHIIEQYNDNRLIRPRADYVGKRNQKYVPVDKR
jgi:citrate synthase